MTGLQINRQGSWRLAAAAMGIILCAVMCLADGPSGTGGPVPSPTPGSTPSPAPAAHDTQRAIAETKLALARYEENKDAPAARKAFQHARDLDPTYPLPLYYLGRLAQEQENWDEAIAAYEAFSKLDDHSDFYVKAQLHLDEVRKLAVADKAPGGKQRRQCDAALAAAKQALTAGRPGDAMTLAAQAATIDPTRWEAPALQAQVEAQLKQWAPALKSLSAALALAPDDKKSAIQATIAQYQTITAAGALQSAAQAAVKEGHDADAGERFYLAFLLAPGRPEWGMSAGLAFKAGGDNVRSAALFRLLSTSTKPEVAKAAAEQLTAVQALLPKGGPGLDAAPFGQPADEAARQVALRGENGKATLVALDELIKADPDNTPATALREKIAPYCRLDVGDILVNSIGMKLTYIPPCPQGFLMGSAQSPADIKQLYGGNEDWFKPEQPQHTVHLSKGFYMATCAVTRGQFGRFVDATGYKTTAEKEGTGYGMTKDGWKLVVGLNWRSTGFDQTDQHPVVEVSWDDAQAFCQWLSDQEHKHYRLPTEAEWEYACRAGTQTAFWWGDNLQDAKGRAKFPDEAFNRWLGQYNRHFDGHMNWDDGFANTAPVGTFAPNPWGLYDMLGNVWQWCSDWYGNYPDGEVTDPTGPATGAVRVLRGGSWYDRAADCRSAGRSALAPDYRCSYYGFRVVLDLSE